MGCTLGTQRIIFLGTNSAALRFNDVLITTDLRSLGTKGLASVDNAAVTNIFGLSFGKL